MAVSETMVERGTQELRELDGMRWEPRDVVRAILTAALSDQAGGWRTDFENAPSPCLGWCRLHSGDVVRVVYRQFWRNIPLWSSHGIETTVVKWQPLPAIEFAPPPSSTAGEG